MSSYLFFNYAAQFVSLLVYVLTTAIFLRAIFSWFVPPGSDNAIMRFLRDITEPILAPLRRVLPQMGMLDLSPFVAMLLLQFVGPILERHDLVGVVKEVIARGTPFMGVCMGQQALFSISLEGGEHPCLDVLPG